MNDISGISFSPLAGNQSVPGRPTGSPVSPVQDAIKLLSFRVPSVVGAGAPSPGALMGGPSPFGTQAASALIQNLLRLLGQGGGIGMGGPVPSGSDVLFDQGPFGGPMTNVGGGPTAPITGGPTYRNPIPWNEPPPLQSLPPTWQPPGPLWPNIIYQEPGQAPGPSETPAAGGTSPGPTGMIDTGPTDPFNWSDLLFNQGYNGRVG